MKMLWVIYRRKLTVFYSQLLGYKVLSLRKKRDTQEHTQYKNNKCLLFTVLFTVLLFFGCAGSQLWHVGSSSPTRDQTQAPALRALSHQTTRGDPCVSIITLYYVPGSQYYLNESSTATCEIVIIFSLPQFTMKENQFLMK